MNRMRQELVEVLGVITTVTLVLLLLSLSMLLLWSSG